MKLQKDWGLVTRMAAVFVALGVMYVALGTAIGLYFDSYVGVAVAIGLFTVVQFYWGDKIALKSMGARAVDQSEYPELHNRVQRLAQQAGLPKPEVAVADTSMPNAFATGRSKNTSVICVTEGLLETLDGDEIDGVLAHEMAHVKHRDMVVMTAVSFLSVIAYSIVRWGWLFDDGGGGGGGGGDSGQPHLLVLFGVSLVVWVLSFFVTRLLSRYREYAADRGAVSITGNPTALATALRKIDGEMADVPDDDLRSNGARALYFSPVETGRWSRLMRTHPETEKRVERLEDLIAEVETGGK